MTFIQVILLAGFIVAAVLAWFVLKKQLFIRLFFLLQFLCAIVLVIWPDLSTQVATVLGVGRGTDLILYLLVVFVYVAGLCILGKFRQLERKITTLTRELAIAKAQSPDNSPTTASCPEQDR